MSLVNTLMVEMREGANLDKWERRVSQYGAWDAYLKQSMSPTGLVTQSLKDRAFSSLGRTLKSPVIDYDSGVTISNTRSVTIADDENTSALQTFTFATYSFGFTMAPTLYQNNDVDYQRDFNTKMLKYIIKLAADLDTAAITALDSAKNQVDPDLLGLYAVVSNVLEAPLAQQEEIIGDIEPIMNSNDYYGSFDVVGNQSLHSVVRKMQEKGEYNNVDKTIQFLGKDFHFTNRISNGVGHKATGYVINNDGLGILTRVELDALNRSRARTGHEWDIELLPILGIPVGTYYYESVGDYNAIAGAASAHLTRTPKQHFGFSVDVAFVNQYNSDIANIPGSVLKFAIKTT